MNVELFDESWRVSRLIDNYPKHFRISVKDFEPKLKRILGINISSSR